MGIIKRFKISEHIPGLSDIKGVTNYIDSKITEVSDYYIGPLPLFYLLGDLHPDDLTLNTSYRFSKCRFN